MRGEISCSTSGGFLGIRRRKDTLKAPWEQQGCRVGGELRTGAGGGAGARGPTRQSLRHTCSKGQWGQGPAGGGPRSQARARRRVSSRLRRAEKSPKSVWMLRQISQPPLELQRKFIITHDGTPMCPGDGSGTHLSSHLGGPETSG